MRERVGVLVGAARVGEPGQGIRHAFDRRAASAKQDRLVVIVYSIPTVSFIM